MLRIGFKYFSSMFKKRLFKQQNKGFKIGEIK